MAAAAMSVVYVLTTPIPEDGGDDTTMEQVMKRNKWDNDDYVCRGLILKVMEQHKELLGILGRFTQQKINMDEAIQVSCITDKLHPSWKDFKHTLNHKKEELTSFNYGVLVNISKRRAFWSLNEDILKITILKTNTLYPLRKIRLTMTKVIKGEFEKLESIKISHESNGIAISQSYYIEKAVSQLEYSRVIGYLMYAMTCTRPDIAFVVVLKGYTDASWISNTGDNSSTSGWVFLLGGGVISWASKEQTCITGSTIESKFVALAAAGNAATLAKAYIQMYNGNSRHLGVRHNMIRELITNGVISIEFVRSQQNLADHLTKGLARDLVIKSAEGMGLNGLKHMYLHVVPRMCLEPAEKEDEVLNFLMVNFFEKVLSRSMNKEEPPI
ncbi:hypothetical protein Tco_0122702 [Tanacetum coccineum]